MPVDIFDTIVEKATRRVAVNGVVYTVHSVTSHDTLKSGVAMLLNLQWDPQKESLSDKSVLELYQRMTPDGASRNQQAKEAIVCAGVSDLEVEGEPESKQRIQLVIPQNMHDKAKRQMWVGYLQKETVDRLYDEVMALSSDGGAALERIAAFRGQSNGAAGHPSPVPSVQPEADAGPRDGS